MGRLRFSYRHTRIPPLFLILAMLAGCGGPSGRGAEHPALEDRVFSLVNAYRREQGLPALSAREDIAEAAREHSRNMAEGRVPPGHAGADERFGEIRDRIGYRAIAENVALNRGYDDPARNTVEGWIESPGHRKNIVGDFDLSGVGVAMSSDSTFYFTQIYVRAR